MSSPTAPSRAVAHHVHGERLSHLRGRVDEHVDDAGEGRLKVGASRQHSDRFLPGAFLLRGQRALDRRRGDRVEEVELAFGPAARRERVEPDLSAR